MQRLRSTCRLGGTDFHGVRCGLGHRPERTVGACAHGRTLKILAEFGSCMAAARQAKVVVGVRRCGARGRWGWGWSRRCRHIAARCGCARRVAIPAICPWSSPTARLAPHAVKPMQTTKCPQVLRHPLHMRSPPFRHRILRSLAYVEVDAGIYRSKRRLPERP
jgi:hypothetical protein